MWRRITILSLLCGAAWADSYTGEGWTVRFNRPDQTTTYSSIGDDEYVIREAFLARIDALASNDWACLATYTFSGNTAQLGAAGPILAAMSNALVRGAKLGFVADKDVNIASNYWPGISLTGLSTRAGNRLTLSRAPDDWGIMHDKVGVFWYRAATQAWVLSASWNFTGGASSYQWNILAEIQNNDLAAAYSNEMREMLSGRFHANPAKSHAHDGARFRLADTNMWTNGWVRFGPYPDGTVGGSNALTDVTNAIDAATDEIVFALNKLTRTNVVEALIRACDRGVLVNGTIPKSDRLPGGDSYGTWQMLANPANYATANRAFLYDAYSSAARTNYDAGEADLTHAKYMAIDPRGEHPLVIHGSANWTASALVATNENDENVLFLPHRGMAHAFVAQFNAMTDGTIPWCGLRSGGSSAVSRLSYWLPYTTAYEVVHATNVFDLSAWTNFVQSLPSGRGTNTVTVTNRAERGFYRVRPVP
ncbi:MAG TPA: hypothetical protein DCM68_06405 [Verrucomicrobia bacterium]|nr:hypothetical protein [Verrucomicrobiota bacterium]